MLASFIKINFIEKHFTLDRKLPGRDNKFAILPEELNQLSNFRKFYKMQIHL